MKKATTTKVSVSIKTALNVPVTGLTAASFTSSSAYVVKSDGSTTSFILTGNISEIDSVNCPGLYTLTIPGTVLDIVGIVSVYLSPATPGSFVPVLYTDEVGISANDLDMIRKAILNNQKINQGDGTLQIVDDNNIDIAFEYYLTDDVGSKSIYNIRNKTRKV